MPRKQASKPNTSAQLSVRTDADLKAAYKEALGSKSMSNDLREHMEHVVCEHGTAPISRDHLPDDEALRQAYLRLDTLSDPDSRRVPIDVAESEIADLLNRPSETVKDTILRPLDRRGYISPRWGSIRVTRPKMLQQ